MIIYMLAAYRAVPASKFLQLAGRKRRWPERSGEELDILVEALFVQCDVGVLAHRCDLEDPEDPAALTEALKHVEEWRALAYVEDLNKRCGVAPSTEDVLQKMEQNRLKIPTPLRPVGKGVAAEVKARMWARRWRDRWGARHGKLRVLDEVPLAEMRSKAQSFLICCLRSVCVLEPKCGPISGFRFWPQKSGRGVHFYIKTNEKCTSRSFFAAGIWPLKRGHFLRPKSPKRGTCSVAVVQLLCSPGAPWKVALANQCRRDFDLLIPGAAEGNYRVQETERPSCR